MTKEYPIAWERCPILYRCLKQLRGMADSLVFEDEDHQITELEQRFEGVSGHPHFVRLRAFIAVEKMLGFIDQVYREKLVSPDETLLPLYLGDRSWAGLTQTKRYLEKLLDRVSLDVTELELGGAKVTQDGIVVFKHASESMSAGMRMRRVQAATQLQHMLKVVLHSIRVLRPYLSNEHTGIAIIGDELSFVTREVYGVTATKPFIQMILELMDARYE